MSQEHVTSLLPAYSLGILEATERLQVAAHLVDCQDCRREWEGYAGLADRLGLAAPSRMPPARLEERLLQRIRPPLHEPAEPARRSWRSLLKQWFGQLPRRVPGGVLAAWVLVLLLVVSNLYLLQQWRGSLRPELAGYHLVQLSGTAAAPQAAGTLLALENRSGGVLEVRGLPQLDARRQYQLWLIHEGRRTSGGVFSVSVEGAARIQVSAPQPLDRYSAFGITIEPWGGSPGPTGSKVLGGSFNLG